MKKVELYRTAVVARNVATHNSEGDLAEGTHVGVRYVCDAYNALRRQTEPVYRVTLIGGKEWGDMYGNCLRDFVL